VRVCLIGMSGVGKSFWAKRLVERGWTRHDCDGAIAAQLAALAPPLPHEEPVHALGRWMGMPWSDGYAEREARYLALEEDVTRAALERAQADPGEHVIDATGSVIYLSAALRLELRASCRVVYLYSSPERRAAMLARYLEEPKPVVWAGAFHGEPSDLAKRYEELLALRDRRYAELAHVTLSDLEAHDPGVDGFLARVLG
jgi:shikimate kinase